MKRRLSISFCLLLSCLTYAQNQAGAFRLLTNKPMAGHAVRFSYNPYGSKLSTTQPVQASVYEFINYKWTVQDVVLAPSQDGTYSGEIFLPVRCAFAALKFYQGNVEAPTAYDNNNNRGFAITPVTVKNTKNPGGAIGLALLRMPALGEEAINYHVDFSNKLEPSELANLLVEESKIPGSDTKNYINAYVSMQKTIKAEQSAVYLTQWLGQMLKRNDLSESNLRDIQGVFKYTLKKQKESDSVVKVILQKYPKGSFARLEAFGNASKSNKTDRDIISAYELFLNKFPYADWLKNPNEQEFIYYETQRVLASRYFNIRDFNTFLAMIPQLNFKALNEIYRWNIEKNYMLKLMSKDSLMNVAAPLMVEMLQKINDGSMGSNGFFSKEHALENAHLELEKRLIIHIGLQADLGRNQEALTNLNYFKEERKFSNPDLNDIHLRILENLKADKLKIRVFMENCVAHNAVSPVMYEKLRTTYLSQQGDPQKFDAYISSLKSSTMKEAMRQQIEKNLMNAAMPEFDLEDLKGNIIHSANWVNKIVVIDFWATWCRPCISALPGMQIIVDKYAKDPSVDFYFVGTMQSDDYKQKTESFIRKEGFRMNFVYDCIDPQTGEQNAAFSKFAKIFNSSGIPRKMVLKDGELRYTTEGYNGSSSELSDELSYVIEMLKSEK